MRLSRALRNIACCCIPWCRRSKRKNQRDLYSQDPLEYAHATPTFHKERHQWNDVNEVHKIKHHNYNIHDNSNLTTEKQKNAPKYASQPTHENRNSLENLDANEVPAINTRPTTDISERLFVYDTAISGLEPGKLIYRRVLLDFDRDRTTNVISDEIPQTLGLPVAPYTGPKVQLPSGKWVMPVGTVDVNWSLFEGVKPYTMHFVVIENSHYDMLLSRWTIKAHEFWEEDGQIIERLNLRC
ncbi:hypothetical protein BDV06DRAFT_172556 [Aspergillus oleicola]